MFERQSKPRVFACVAGADFPERLVNGMRERLGNAPPETMGRVEIFVNTRRMQRRIIDLFDQGPAALLPKTRVIADLAHQLVTPDLPAGVSFLRRRLELSQLISQLIARQPDLAPRAALFDLADSLALLLGEMQDEGVSADAIRNLDVSDKSGHWQRSQMFLDIVDQFYGGDSSEPPDAAGRQRMITEQLIAQWAIAPPNHPVIVAGSTGSRGTTSMLMQAVSKLPQGALILPGFDFELPDHVWTTLKSDPPCEDHPQYRYSRLMSQLGLLPSDITNWTTGGAPDQKARNRLISLALRPAPVTSQWMVEGPRFDGVDAATAAMTLLEAPSPRVEAVAISMIMRRAVDAGKTVALVTPDRVLTRRVAASLERWNIEPDASVGSPLSQSAPGRLLLHVAEQLGRALSAEDLLIILKHPLVNASAGHRGQHLRWTRDLEGYFRRYGPPHPAPADILNWAEKSDGSDAKAQWANWVITCLFDLQMSDTAGLGALIDCHINATLSLAAGPDNGDASHLWDKPSGEAAEKVVNSLRREAAFGGPMTPFDYATLFRATLSREETRDPIRPHPNVMIWGTLEARVQGADLVILGGLNEGVWPEMPAPDPWLNRNMRQAAGLLLPERRVGLSAHDFQQAVAAKEVVLSRSARDASSETVPSRWVNRITNLLQGMSESGENALLEMRERGQYWLEQAAALDTPKAIVPPTLRPSPRPPVASRPDQLSVTSIARLIRDPYSIYAEKILGLRRLDPLRQLPDAPVRGTVLHKILYEFMRTTDGPRDVPQLLQIADDVMAKHAPWPAARALWRAKLERVADWFLDGESTRQANGKPVALERKGALHLPEIDFTLTGTADRIDQTSDGGLVIYDYKTGSTPTEKQLRHFDKQLFLEALMAEAGAFENLAAGPVSQVAHIGLGASPKFAPVILEPDEIAEIRAGLIDLLGQFQVRTQGYISRRAVSEQRFESPYDHLARFKEWDETQDAIGEDVGP